MSTTLIPGDAGPGAHMLEVCESVAGEKPVLTCTSASAAGDLLA